MTDSDHLTVDVADGVGRIVMDRPEKHNSMDPGMARDLRSAIRRVADDGSARCLVLTGTRGVYNTGADLSTLEGDESDAERIESIASPLHDAIRALTTAPKPVVTGINGVAAGGGIGLSIASDVALCAEDARFEFAYPKIGLSGDGGATWFLPRLVGLRRTQEFAFLDEPIGPEEAVDRGLVTEAVSTEEFDDRLAEIAADLADGPTRAYGRLRRLLFESRDRTLNQQLALEKDQITRLTFTEDYAAGIEAFLGKEDPAFEGR